MTVICAAVIAGSAAWTQQAGFRRVTPSPAPDGALAADLWQQSLSSAATPSPAPENTPAPWLAPVAAQTVLRGFDAQQLVPSGIAGLWQVHDAVDLAAARGDAVTAMRDGTVLEVRDQAVLGMCAVIDHGDGYVAEYAGLASLEGLAPGQRIQAGQVIGRAGGGIHGQASPACLHLRLTRDGVPIDPMTLLSSPQP